MADRTGEILERMLKENTGQHWMDSGGGQGRHWQRNQYRFFEREPVATLHISCRHGLPEIEYVLNLYHYLKDRLTYSREWTRQLEHFMEQNDLFGWEAMVEFVHDYLIDQMGYEVSGIFGEGNPVEDNTYNHQNNFSQDAQFIFATVNDQPLVFLQIHGGADIRGGYSQPKVFESDEDRWFDFGYGSIDVQDRLGKYNFDKGWYTDDGYNWYPSSGRGPQLNSLECVNFEDIETGQIQQINDAIREGKRQLEWLVRDDPEREEHWVEAYRKGMASLLEERHDILLDLSEGDPDRIYIDDDGNGYVEGYKLVP
jgi:hypothetical protein